MTRRWLIALVAAALGATWNAAPAAAAGCDAPAGGAYGVAVERYVPFVNRFGETISVDLFLPADASGRALTAAGCRFPVVLQVDPYRDWTTPQPASSQTKDASRRWWAQRGYVFAYADVPGTGGSDGQWCLFCRHEQLSGVDMVERMGTQPWSTGKVGLIGASYPGIEAMLIAQHRPPHLAALIAGMFFLSPYRDFFYIGGMERGTDRDALLGGYTGLSRWTGRYQAPTSAAEAQRFAQVWTERETSPPPDFLRVPLEHPTLDAWYLERTVHPERVEVPTYVFGGWEDMFDDATWRAFDHLGTEQKYLLQTPLPHVSVYAPADAWPCESAANDLCGAPLFDHVLKGVDTPEYEALAARPVRLYVSPYGATADDAYLELPAKPAVSAWRLPLGEHAARATLLPNPAAGATSGQWFLRGTTPDGRQPGQQYAMVDGPLTQKAEEATAIHVSTPPLDHDVTIVGGAKASLVLRSDRPDGDVVVRLLDEWPAGGPFPAGYDYLVTSGWLRLSHRDGHSAGLVRPMPIGEDVAVEVDLFPTGYRFAAGHRIGIEIQPADTPRFRPPTDTATLDIDLGQSSIRLPSLPSPPPS